MKGDEAASPSVESQDKMLGGAGDIVSPGGTSFVMEGPHHPLPTSTSGTEHSEQHGMQASGRSQHANVISTVQVM